MLVVGGVALAIAVLLGAVSSLSLRAQLVGGVDRSLEASAERGRMAPDRDGSWGGDGPAPTPPPTDGSDGAGSGQGSGAGGDTPPLGLGVLGQAAGTIVVEVSDGVASGAYIDEDAQVVQLDDAQVADLEDVGTAPEWVTLDGLGTYRAMATERSDGTRFVTALPWADSAETLQRYLVVELLVGALAVVLAAAAATVLVRRALRPLDRVAQTAARVSELPLDRGDVAIAERVPARDTDERTEVGKVGAAVNRMLGHVESSLAARHESETTVRAFVADASHELRTPLASIRGYSELVLRRGASTGELSPETEHAVGRVAAEGKRMQALVEDLLLLARLDAGRELTHADVDLVAIAVDVTSDAHAAGRDHRWRLDVPEDGVPPVPGDEPRLRQVLVNLLGNARVHTPAGTTVTTSVRAGHDGELGDVVVLTVTDDGPGIDPALLPTLFDRFSRGDTARGRGQGELASTGLGLAIAEAIVSAHGGRIAVDSVPGRTSFTVLLPTEGGAASGRMDR
ncbi:HAMP domain-containing histidine kinase [Miniimonas arenae]|uniref:histidine kinase n=1 Tax=Miniimonas arenae TaxID=676201 RepID=A0A5C5BFY5_9MICO|nr:HAMP domain-containing histidine kinase [Miniimonas arenae]